jgi:nucleotide-binding universal stress UspA family protein
MSAPVVLVAYDGSPAARRALVHAADIVGRSGTVTVVNVIATQSVGSRLQTVTDDQRDRQKALLEEARSVLASHGVHSEFVAVCGNPYTEILDTAERIGAQMLVVGRSRRWRHLLSRSLAIRLASRAPRDVLVVG